MEHHKISTSDKIHPFVEGLFQQLSIAFVAATGKSTGTLPAKGTKGRVTTARRSASTLASCLNFNRNITTRRNHSSFTNAYEIPKVLKCPEQSQNNIRQCRKLDAQPMKDLFSRLGSSSQDVARPTSNSLPQPPRTTAKASTGRAAGSTEESNTKTQ